MLKERFEIINKLGLHARAASKLTALAQSFESDIRIHKDDKAVDAKSIMALLMLAASKGTVIDISATGRDNQAALTAIGELINRRFDEQE